MWSPLELRKQLLSSDPDMTRYSGKAAKLPGLEEIPFLGLCIEQQAVTGGWGAERVIANTLTCQPLRFSGNKNSGILVKRYPQRETGKAPDLQDS